MTKTFALIAALLLGGMASAHELTVGDLQFIHPHIPQPAVTAQVAGGYLAISNAGAQADLIELWHMRHVPSQSFDFTEIFILVECTAVRQHPGQSGYQAEYHLRGPESTLRLQVEKKKELSRPFSAVRRAA
jgi:hypothetical protein